MKPTEQYKELFELCKEVYKRSGWKQEPDISYLYKYWDNHDELCVISIEEADDSLVPAYTSDYLLEKLPVGTNIAKTHTNNIEPLVYYSATCHGNGIHQSDTPLKALLKLTIKMHEEKIL